MIESVIRFRMNVWGLPQEAVSDLFDTCPGTRHVVFYSGGQVCAASRIVFPDLSNADLVPYGNFHQVLAGFLPCAMLGRLVVASDYCHHHIATDMVVCRLHLLRNSGFSGPVVLLLRPEAVVHYRKLGFTETHFFSKELYPSLPWATTVLAVIPDLDTITIQSYQSIYYDQFIHF